MNPNKKKPAIHISDYTYDLPSARIAQFPLEERDASRLLIRSGTQITENTFRNIAYCIPEKSLLVFNDTKVVRARILFQKPSGSVIEVFCLEPLEPTRETALAFRQSATCTWRCLIGNAKRWKEGLLRKAWIVQGTRYQLSVRKIGDTGDGTFAVTFCWEPAELSFGELLERIGQVPLPPYITRDADPEDGERYQTIFARFDGSVAAPTAGLHFTERVMKSIRARHIQTTQVTLHVGLGTFRPITASVIQDHVMHAERFLVSRTTIQTLLECENHPVVCVGTTSLRTIESLYWLGLQVIQHPSHPSLKIDQWEPYRTYVQPSIPSGEALLALINYLDKHNLSQLEGETQLLIMPGYHFYLASGLVTNFHQPQSTLLLLIAAFLGDDWRSVYQYALDHDFRFLSYGDACLFL